MVGVDGATTRRMELSVPLSVVEEKREGGGEDGGARGGKRLGFYRGRLQQFCRRGGEGRPSIGMAPCHYPIW
jgi:hypothetical protein